MPDNELQEALRIERDNMQERISELELALEDTGWIHLDMMGEFEFSREALRKIARQSKLFYAKNPLIGCAVRTQVNYTFGQGVSTKAPHPLVDDVVQTFKNDSKNKAEFTTILAKTQKEIDLQITGNLFFIFFTNDVGDVRIRTIPFDEITDIKMNPEDRKEPWYYVRHKINGETLAPESELYPDWEYNPKERPDVIDGKKVHWDSPIYHVKTNALSEQKFGVSELYAAQDWAQAYQKFLSDWASIVRSHAKFAWNITTKGGQKARAAGKAKLDSQISQGKYEPSSSAGSVFLSSEDTKLSPVKTAGGTTKMNDGRRLLLMVCAATNLPETFFGDVSVGTLATAKSLDRPTELKFKNRQRLWETVIENIYAFVIRMKARFGEGALSGSTEIDEWGEEYFVYADDTENEDPELRDKPINTYVDVSFPKLVEDDMKATVNAVVSAATLNGKVMAGVLDSEYVAEQLLRALGETSIEEVMERLFPEGEEETEGLRESITKLRTATKRLLKENE